MLASWGLSENILSNMNYQQVNINGIFKQTRQMGPESSHIRRMTVDIFKEERKVSCTFVQVVGTCPGSLDTQQSSKVKASV